MFNSILAEPTMQYMDHPSLHGRAAERDLFVTSPPLPDVDSQWYRPTMDLIGNHRSHDAQAQPILTRRQEQTIFLQFNFARLGVATLQAQMRGRRPKAAMARQLIERYDQVECLKQRIVQFNLALVLAMIRRISPTQLDLAELISEGNIVLLNAVEKFDAGRNFKFSTYACRSILKAFGRMSRKHARRRQLFNVSYDPTFDRCGEDGVAEALDQRESIDQVRRVLADNLAELTPMELKVIERRFPLKADPTAKRMTLEQVGRQIGYSKERTRYIQNRALAKIRSTLEEPSADRLVEE